MKVRDKRELIWRNSVDAEMDGERQGGVKKKRERGKKQHVSSPGQSSQAV